MEIKNEIVIKVQKEHPERCEAGCRFYYSNFGGGIGVFCGLVNGFIVKADAGAYRHKQCIELFGKGEK